MHRRAFLRTSLALCLALLAGAFAVLADASVAHARLKAPALASPADDQQVSSVPAFTWNRVKRADRYEFMLSADANFGSIVLGRNRGSFTTKNLAATVNSSLPDGTYWWRVRAISAKSEAGPWSARRSLRKVWAPAPAALGPQEGGTVLFPQSPLVLRWSAVPRAFKYRVYLGTDPGLGSLVLGKNPVETSATVFSPSGSLPPGTYYWAVEPVDAAGHRGPRSAVSSFVWSWPSTTSPAFHDLVADGRMTEPHLTWNPIPGAVGYEVEINFSQDFAVGSRVCCDQADTGISGGLVLGTAFSPKRVLPSNVYHWRVRGIDADGNAGRWNVGTAFDQFYGTGAGTIQNLRLRDNHGDLVAGATTSTPVLAWDPVPGAGSYVVQVTRYESGECKWATTATGDYWDVTTNSPAFTVLAPSQSGTLSFENNGVSVSTEGGKALVDGRSYCARVHARRGDTGILSDMTQLGGAGQPAFTYQAFTPAPAPSGPLAMPQGHYVAPQDGSTTPRAPLLTWERVEGAASYYVVISKNQAFTNVVDVALTRNPAYSPRTRTYADDNTPYYWAVIPAKQANGVDGNAHPTSSYRAFNKRSAPPALVAPAPGAVIDDHPVFRWRSADPVVETPEGASEYRLQVASDTSFVEPLDDVVTKSTSYTAARSYPADTDLYWRVRVNDANGVGLTWSAPVAFRRRLPVPSILPGNADAGSVIPALTWSPVQGASSYDVHVDQADGTRKDFEVRGTAFTPVFWYGPGIWHWQVRARFPGGASRTVTTSAYTPSAAFARRIPSPDGVHAETRGGRMLMAWEPTLSAGIREYRVDLASSDSFAKIGQTIRTQNLSVAPDVTKAPFVDGGRVYWRIFAVDEGGNLGAAAAGRFVTARRMVLKVTGAPVRGRRVKVSVQALDARGRKVRKAKVRVSGRPLRATARRTNRRGIARFALRARRKGTVLIRATRDGFRPAVSRLTVR